MSFQPHTIANGWGVGPWDDRTCSPTDLWYQGGDLRPMTELEHGGRITEAPSFEDIKRARDRRAKQARTNKQKEQDTMSEQIDWGEWSGSYGQPFKFETPGMSIAGTITRIHIATINGDRLPSLTIRDNAGVEWSVLAGNVNLQAKLAELRPASGDRIAMVFTGFGEAQPGKSAPKLFDVQLAKGAPAAAAAPAPAQPVHPASPQFQTTAVEYPTQPNLAVVPQPAAPAQVSAADLLGDF